MSEPTWDAFVASLTNDASPHDGDRVLWRVTKPGREIVCSVREIRPASGFIARELRVAHDGEIYLTESHRELVAFQRRVEELRRMLEAEDWTEQTN